MAKFQSPVLGFNNNVRHKNRVFHIQTEDSGVQRPHIITHLFMDGGRILKSVKRSYAEHVGTETMRDVVRELMKDQHKAIFTALKDGEFDALVESGSPASRGAASSGNAARPASGQKVPEALASQPLPASEAPDTEPNGRTIGEAAPPPSGNEPPPVTAKSAVASAERPAVAAPRPPLPALSKDERVGDQSLDEVILSYLAEDLDPNTGA
jgi:hypothetical protein